MGNASRYLIGIDLGTTNSVLAYIDTEAHSPDINVFNVPQLAGPGEVVSMPALPSFLYFPTEDELKTGLLGLSWDEYPSLVTGVMAREHGALIPARQVMSAKSWLSHSGVDRSAKILPREADPPLISPVEASARYLMHLRDAWNAAFVIRQEDALRFEKQEIVLTVPASFDEEARELTVEAARQVGIENLILLEEPLAAFYSWIASHQESLKHELSDGDLVLICDIGGGTTDFSLIRARVVGEQVEFERKAIGEHLLLGGDNLDLALARRVEEKIGASRLSMRQRHGLQRACAAAKERLLCDPSMESMQVTVLGGGRRVVGEMLSAELHRDEVLEFLTDGFLPLTSMDDLPKTRRAAGLRELGLPYAADPAITKHLALFLRQAAAAMSNERAFHGDEGARTVAKPDAILFNGGFCSPTITRERIADAIARWFSVPGKGWHPKILGNEALGSAVAEGAAHYALVRHGFGVRVRANSARSYYIAVGTEQHMQGVCVLPAGVEEGTTLPPVDRQFAALANRPVSFTLYSSRTRHDAHGGLAELDGEEVHRHAPLVTLLRYGKKMRDVELAVRLRVTFTELGTLELWCESMGSPHRWRLQFQLRGDQSQLVQEERQASPVTTPGIPSVQPGQLQEAEQLIRATFAKHEESDVVRGPDTLMPGLESVLGVKRDSWPAGIIRRFADVLLENMDGRKNSPRHEVRWLNLLGFCLRPGFGMPGDESRVNVVRKVSLSGPVFARELQSEVEWLVLLRRVCGGLNASQQHEFYRKHFGPLKAAGKNKGARLNPQVEYDTWRLLASMEHLPASTRVSLGGELVARIRKDPEEKRWFWPLARVGARIPLYGPLSCVVSPETAAEWLALLLALQEISPEILFAILQLGRRTDDPSRDISDSLRKQALRALKAAGIADDSIRPMEKFIPPERADAVRMFGDSLPKDLQLFSSSSCLLSLTALTSDLGQDIAI